MAEIFQTEQTDLSSVDSAITRCMEYFVPFHAALVELIQKLVLEIIPDVVKISQHLSNTSSETVTIDFISYSCYKIHCSIIEFLKPQHGSDTMLWKCIDEWVSKKTNENTDRLTKAILDTVMYVANNLLILGKAVLLPYCMGQLSVSVCVWYWACPLYNINTKGFHSNKRKQFTFFSGKWLLHQLILYLNAWMLYKCTHEIWY